MKQKKYRKQMRLPNGTRESATFSSKADAEKWTREKLREKELMRAGLTASFHSIKTIEWAANWLNIRKARGKPEGSWKQDETRLRKYILPEFGQIPIHVITTAMWNRFLDEVMIGYSLSSATRNRIRSLLSKMYVDAKKAGHCLHNPITDIEKLNESQDSWSFLETKEDIHSYLNAASSEGISFKVFATLALNTGARVGEILALKKTDIDLNLMQISISKIYDQDLLKVVSRTKSKKNRYVGISPALRSALLEFMKSTSDRPLDWPLVCTENGAVMHPRVLRERHNRVCKLAQIKAITPHDLRHTFASHFVMNGGSLWVLQSILGHSSHQTTLRYAHLAPGHLKAQAGLVSFGVEQCDLDNVVSIKKSVIK